MAGYTWGVGRSWLVIPGVLAGHGWLYLECWHVMAGYTWGVGMKWLVIPGVLAGHGWLYLGCWQGMDDSQPVTDEKTEGKESHRIG